MIEESVTFGGFDAQPMDLYIARPDKLSPGLIIVHEVYGLNENIKGIARRFAAEGFASFAPNLYSRDKGFLNEASIVEAMSIFSSIPVEKRGNPEAMKEAASGLSENSRKVIDTVFGARGPLEENMTKDLQNLYDYVNTRDYVYRDHVGATGFCLGGGMAFELAVESPIRAVFVFYGRNPAPIDRVSKMAANFMGVYAGEDPRIDAGLPELVSAFSRHKKNFTIKMYAEAFHGFFNDTGKAFNPVAASDAWELALRHFRKNLM